MTIQGINFFTHGIKPPEDMQSLQAAQGSEGVEEISEAGEYEAKTPVEEKQSISMDMGVDEEPMLDLEHLKKGFQQE